VASARSLFGHKAEPRRELTPVLEGACVTGSHRADPFDLAETLTDLAVAIELSDPPALMLSADPLL
jgi:hypothetical protein